MSDPRKAAQPPHNPTWDSRDVGGVVIDLGPRRASMEQLVQLACSVSTLSTGAAVHFANAYTISLAAHDDSYRDLLNRPDSLVMPDGRPLVWTARLAYRSDPNASRWEQVRGPEAFPEILVRTQDTDASHYFLGGTEEALNALLNAVRRHAPRASIAGWESPPFRDLGFDEQQQQDERIRQSGASIVWVGLGTPRQDWEAARIARTMPVMAIAVGAAFDFFSGNKPEAPAWMRHAGLEWLFRWMSEPRRLTKRYLVGNAIFTREALLTGLAARWRESRRR